VVLLQVRVLIIATNGEWHSIDTILSIVKGDELNEENIKVFVEW